MRIKEKKSRGPTRIGFSAIILTFMHANTHLSIKLVSQTKTAMRQTRDRR